MPYVGDSKRAMDEYTSEIFMGGKNTLVSHWAGGLQGKLLEWDAAGGVGCSWDRAEG